MLKGIFTHSLRLKIISQNMSETHWHINFFVFNGLKMIIIQPQKYLF